MSKEDADARFIITEHAEDEEGSSFTYAIWDNINQENVAYTRSYRIARILCDEANSPDGITSTEF